MPSRPTISFSKPQTPTEGTLVLLAPEGGAPVAAATGFDEAGAIGRAIQAASFKGKAGSSVELLAPHGTRLERVVVVGAGKADDRNEESFLKLGGSIQAAARKARRVTVHAQIEGAGIDADAAAQIAMGILLRAYAFDKYKTRKDDDKDDQPKDARFVIACDDPDGATARFEVADAVAGGVELARDLVNEPANALGPIEFAQKAKDLEALGMEVEILDVAAMEALKMGALLGVAQGSDRPARLAVMKWNGGREGDKPIAFVGKGVVFDSGGISIKPAASMEDMKGDMGGAAAVIGLMRALAARKAKANVVGILGLVENMLDGKAQRPGDIVTSMSGQTIEIINTDAEGRLVLADALWYCNDRFAPRFIINLATLTGAVMVALGQSHAGLFSNDDELAARVTEAGKVTGEKVWRLPLGPEYDKIIDSKFADMKNSGGRNAGAITAAQFLKRFVKDTPWAHIDVAGTAMASPSTEISQSWASGYGVRLLDRLVRDHYEDGAAG